VTSAPEAAPQAAPAAAPQAAAPQAAPQAAPHAPQAAPGAATRTLDEALAGWSPEPVQVYQAAEVAELGEAPLYDALRASGVPFKERPDGSLRVITGNGYELTISDAVSAGILRVSRFW